MIHYNRQREKMVEGLRRRGISDERVLRAMLKVERHRFVAPGAEFQAYDDKALPIGFEQTISHPYTVALMSQALEVEKGQKILEIGSGSGYQAAVLCEMGAQVFTIERIAALGKKAESLLRDMRYHFALRVGDGTLGWQNYAPYDAIIVTAGAPVNPKSLLPQVKNGGRLLIPLGDKNNQMLTLFLKTEQEIRRIELEPLSFVPLIGKHGWTER